MTELPHHLKDWSYEEEKLTKESIQRIRLMHSEKYKDITGTPVCRECDQYLPCNTIRALD
jgi:hypothetical protein